MYTSSSVSPFSYNSADIEIVYPSNDQTANTESNLEISGISTLRGSILSVYTG